MLYIELGPYKSTEYRGVHISGMLYIELGPYRSTEYRGVHISGMLYIELGPYKSTEYIEVSTFQGCFILNWVPTKVLNI